MSNGPRIDRSTFHSLKGHQPGRPVLTKMTEEQNSDEISFHLYIDAVKEKKIPWKAFEKLMKDFYYPDLERLEHLNSMILMELTKSYSHLERSKCLNAILLNKLKNSMEEKNFGEIQDSDNTIHKKIQVDKKMTEEQTADQAASTGGGSISFLFCDWLVKRVISVGHRKIKTKIAHFSIYIAHCANIKKTEIFFIFKQLQKISTIHISMFSFNLIYFSFSI